MPAMHGAYTDFPEMPPNVVFPRPEMQALSAVIFLTGSSILSFILTRRSLRFNPFSVACYRQWSLPRLTCLGVYVCSWAFVYSSGILILGVGMSFSPATCSLGIFSCIFFYASSKVLIYLFLIEKVHIVSNTSKPRLKSPLYRICLVFWTPYIVILVLMIVGRVADIDRHNRACHIGLEKFASLSLLIYDLFLNVFLTMLFVWPILTSSFKNPKIRRVAIRTMLSALMALTTSTVNILVLTLMHGRQLGWVCLGSCGTDVTINALVLFYVTMSGGSSATATEREDVLQKEQPAPGMSSPSAAVQSFAMRSGGKPTVIVARGGGGGAPSGSRGVHHPGSSVFGGGRNDYVYFPEPVEPLDPTKLGETDVSPEDGGGYVIPRDDADKAAAAIKAAELDFTQRPFELSRPAQPKVDPRATKSLLGNLKRTLGLHHETVDSIEERSIGLQSTAGVAVVTEIVTEYHESDATAVHPGEHRHTPTEGLTDDYAFHPTDDEIVVLPALARVRDDDGSSSPGGDLTSSTSTFGEKMGR